MKLTQDRRIVYHPATVLFVAFLAAAIFALWVQLVFDGELRWFLQYYFAPIGVPFVCFLFDRAERYASLPLAAWLVDAMVLIPALVRAIVPIPMISGHALFLTYSLFTSRSGVARVTALLILAQVAYIKTFMWHDATLAGGTIAGSLAAFVFYLIVSGKLKARTGP